MLSAGSWFILQCKFLVCSCVGMWTGNGEVQKASQKQTVYGVKRLLTSVATSNKRPRLISSELGNVHLADLLRESSPQQPQSTTSVDEPIPDSSTSQSAENNPLLKRLLMENERDNQVRVNSSRTNEAEPVQKECTKNSLLKVLNQILVVSFHCRISLFRAWFFCFCLSAQYV